VPMRHTLAPHDSVPNSVPKRGPTTIMQAQGGGLLRPPSDHRTGGNLHDFGPFLIGNLVGVGCRMMALGSGLGTLGHTGADANVCLI
jgi:hypothetical protein